MLDKQIEERERNEKEKTKSHKFVLVGPNQIECIGCSLKHGGVINTGRECLREDGHIYAIRDFGKFKKGDMIL